MCTHWRCDIFDIFGLPGFYIFSSVYLQGLLPSSRRRRGTNGFSQANPVSIVPPQLNCCSSQLLVPPLWLNCTLPPLVVHLHQSVPLILPGQSFYPCSSLSTSTYIFVDRRWCIWSFVCKILFLKPNQFSHSGIAQCTGLIQNDKRKFLWENPAIRVCKACHLSIKPGPCM